MPSGGLRACIMWLIAALIAPCMAQTSKLFQWKFANDGLSSSLPTCFPLSVIVESYNTTTNDTIGTPPYYMTAFVVGGTPVTTFIGTDQNNLSWTVTEPVGSRLVLSVVDANGSTGGVPPRIFTVIAGSTTQCVTTPISTPAFTVTANVTGDLQTCQPWGFTVEGGVPPYVITFAQTDSPVVTNVTMLSGDDAFMFINRADPNKQLIGAVSDLTGRWARGTPIVNTKGSSDTTCTGLVSLSGKAADAPQSTGSTKKKKALAIGLSIALLLVFLMALGVGGFIYLRRRRREDEALFFATVPRQFVAVEAQVPSVPARRAGATDDPPPFYNEGAGGGVTLPPQSHYRNPSSPDSHNSPSTTGISYYPSVRASDNRPSRQTSQASTEKSPRYLTSPAAARRTPGGFTNFPSTSIRRSAKSFEAATHSAVSPDSEYVLDTALSDASNVLGRQLSALSSVTGRTGTGAAAPRGFGSEDRVEEEPETVYQHRDGGVVRELPPPYMIR